MAFTGAQRTARYREAHPDRVAVYKSSERGRAVARNATARRGQLRHIAKRKGYAPPDFSSVRPKPEISICQCCEKPKPKLVMDHDHKTGLFRGWICDDCNIGIGKLGDNAAGVERTLAYLRRAL